MVLIGIQPLRYAYLPLALFLGLLAGLAPAMKSRSKLSLTAAGAFVLMGSFFTLQRLPEWQNDHTIWTAEYSREPDNPWAMSRLGRARLGLGQDRDGVQIWLDAIELEPEGIQLFVLQKERLLLAESVIALASQERLPPPEAAAISMRMCCQIILDSEADARPLPAPSNAILDLMEASAILVGAPAESASQLLAYCSE